VSRLQCDRCGLVYERAAIVREIQLVTGCPCRRCGGTLYAQETPGSAAAPRAGETAATRPLPPERR
jgi:predicted  nucleic acid-binding Zn-ribbon protein